MADLKPIYWRVWGGGKDTKEYVNNFHEAHVDYLARVSHGGRYVRLCEIDKPKGLIVRVIRQHKEVTRGNC